MRVSVMLAFLMAVAVGSLLSSQEEKRKPITVKMGLEGQVTRSKSTVTARPGDTLPYLSAAVRRHMGAPFSFPGGGGFVTEMTDARLLARAIVWAGGNPRCYGETFNITNGDVVEWESIWPDLASHFDMPVGPAEPQQLSAVMPPLARVWDEVAAKHGLQRRTMEEVVGLSWQFADAVFGVAGTGRSTLLSTIKSRQLGFTDCIDSARMFCEHFAILEASGMLPRP